MSGIYPKRELSRRKKAALVIAMGLALGIALVITVNSVSAGMTQAHAPRLATIRGGQLTLTEQPQYSGHGY
ncbi:hypothetical protein ABT315_15725 [Streptomyces puniciscabiei]